MIDLKTLRELVKLMKSNDLTEVDIQDENERVKLRRGNGDQPQVQVVPPASAPPPAAAPASPAPAPAAAPAAAAEPAKDDGLIEITSPTVGTFYSASSPDADPFVAVGSKVTADSVVCIVEAMKVFNEIKAETSGVVAEILVNNGDAIEFGQPLFKVKPS